MIFRTGEFTLHGGQKSRWKIDLDDLETSDWETLALMISECLAPFSQVEGVPQGGLSLAAALERYLSPCGGLLLTDDVLTTGGSMEDQRRGRPARGVVVFARGPVPSWITPVFPMGLFKSAPNPPKRRVWLFRKNPQERHYTAAELEEIGPEGQLMLWNELIREGWHVNRDGVSGEWHCWR